MRAAVAALLVGCVVLAACAAPAHASRSDADEEAGYPIQPAGMDLARIQSFVQSLVTGEAAKPAEAGDAHVQNKPKWSKYGRKRSEYKTEDEEEKKGYGKHKKGSDYEKEDKPYGVHKHMCKQVLLEEEEVLLEWASDDKGVITTLQGTCANAKHPLPTLGGGCAVVCEHDADLLKVTALGSHAFAAPAHFAPVSGYFPVSCSFRTEGPLKGACKVSMKVACCSNKDLAEKKHDEEAKEGKYVTSAAAYADGEAEGREYNEDGEVSHEKPKVEHSYYKGGKSAYKSKYAKYGKKQDKYAAHKKEDKHEHEEEYAKHEEHEHEEEAPKAAYEYPKADAKEPEPELVEDEAEYLVIVKTDVKHIKAADYYAEYAEKPSEPYAAEEKPEEHEKYEKPARHSYERRSDEYHHA